MFFIFFSPQLILQKSNEMVLFKENYFQGSKRESNIFQGGVQLFPGGSNCLFPIETHIVCDFPGGVRTPCPPSGSALAVSQVRPPARAKMLQHFFTYYIYTDNFLKFQLKMFVSLKLKTNVWVITVVEGCRKNYNKAKIHH